MNDTRRKKQGARARWWAALGITWLLLLGVPQLRAIVRSHVSTAQTMRVDYDAWYIDGPAVAERFPHDLNARAVALMAGSGAARTNEPLYDNLIAEYPNQPWLVANRLRYTMMWFLDSRVGDGENTTSTRGQGGVRQPPTAAELERSIAMARIGARLEPDNNYYDWMLALFLFGAGRDDEAIRTIENGARKSTYDEHLYDSAHAYQMAQRLVGRTSLDDQLHAHGMLLLPHYARFRHLARLVVSYVNQQERAGDLNGALRTRAAFAALCEPMMRGRNIVMIGRVGAANQHTAWIRTPSSPKRGNTLTVMESPDAVLAEANRFAAYARSHGQDELAAATLRQASENARFRTLALAHPLDEDYFGMPPRLCGAIQGCTMLGLATLLLLALFLPVGGVLSVMLLFAHRTPPGTRDLRWSLGSGVAVAFFAAVGAIAAGASYRLPWLSMYSGDSRPEPVWFIVVLGCYVIAPPLLAWLVCGLVTARRAWRQRAVWKAEARSGTDSPLMPTDRRPAVVAFCAWCLWLAAFGVAMLAALGAAAEAGYASAFLPLKSGDIAKIALVLGAFSYGVFIARWRWPMPAPAREHYHYGLRWYQQTICRWVVIASVFYLILAVLELPLQSRAGQYFERWQEQGEIAQMLNSAR